MSTTSTTKTTWRNWSGAVRCTPQRLAAPTSTAEVAQVLAEAARDGLTVRPVGSGHSFTPLCATDGVQVRLDGMARLLGHTPDGRVRVQAGMSLRTLNRELDRLGLALPNLGDVDPQTVAGAIGTGTHGTGDRLHGIAKAVDPGFEFRDIFGSLPRALRYFSTVIGKKEEGDLLLAPWFRCGP